MEGLETSSKKEKLWFHHVVYGVGDLDRTVEYCFDLYWRVDLAARGDTLLFGDGWSDFVSDHNLGEHDLMFFKFAGESRFEVLMFDARSLCEKEASYFVKGSGVEKKQTSKEAVVVENRAIIANLSPK